MKRAILAVVLGVVFAGVPASAQAPPVPTRLKAITEQLHAKNVALAEGSDEQRRELTKKVIEQIVFEFPGDGWGWKSASPTRPPSKDCIARRGAGWMVCYDWQNGTTRRPIWPFILNDIANQHWIDVAGKDHLSVAPPSDPDPPSDPPPTTGPTLAEALAQLQAQLAAIGAKVDALAVKVDGVAGQVAALPSSRPWPVYRGSIPFLGSVTLSPQER